MSPGLLLGTLCPQPRCGLAGESPGAILTLPQLRPALLGASSIAGAGSFAGKADLCCGRAGIGVVPCRM